METTTETISPEIISKMSEFISTMATSKNSEEELKQIFTKAAGMAGVDGDKASAFVEISLEGVMEERERRTCIMYEYLRKEQIKKQWAERKARRVQKMPLDEIIRAIKMI
jgi:hypothetical protein